MLFFFLLFRSIPVAYGGSQTRCLIYTTATAMPDLSCIFDLHHWGVSLTHWVRPGIEPTTSCFLVRFISSAPWWELLLFYFIFFLWPPPRHMVVPRLGVKLELQPPAYATATAMPYPSYICDLHHSSGQCRILNPLIEAWDQNCVLMNTSQINFCWAMMGTPQVAFYTECIVLHNA